MRPEKNLLIFEDFSYGMAKSQVLAKAEAEACTPPHPLALCAVAPVEFLQLKWQATFWFNNEDKLQQIMLAHAGSEPDSLRQLERKLKNAGWLPVYFESDTGALDLIEQSREHGEAELPKIADRFVQAGLDSGGEIAVSFLPAKFAEKALKNASISTWSQAVDSGPDDLRMLDLRIAENNITASFTLPLLSRKNALRYGQMIKR